MTQQKSKLQEVAAGNKAVKAARSEPIQQEQPKQSMDFIRSLMLDIPIQTTRQQPVSESFNLESMLMAQLEAEASKREKTPDQTDHVSFDIPLLIRILEHAREGIKSDVELHDMVERIVALRTQGVLNMTDYAAISGGDIEGTDKEHAPQAFAGQQQGESIDWLKKLAGLG